MTAAISEAVHRISDLARVRRVRSMREFAESEIILPTGPYQGLRFNTKRQPWTRLWWDAIDSGQWRRFLLTGPSQAGKTLNGSAIPVMYHLFERRETVIYAAPTLDMAEDKWREDIRPLIMSSRYRDLMPASGAGSKGGLVSSIQFKHGPTLRFMTGGGDDKVRAGFTSRVVVVTEVDGLDEAGGSSREGDKLSQLEARTNAFEDRARIYLECTVSTEEGRTWKELKGGTDSRLVMPCPHCCKWVTPEREHLTGWHEAESVTEAREKAALACPGCGAEWTDAQRIEANTRAVLAHRGQSVDDSGTTVGMMPATHTFGLRFTAINNTFSKVARVAEEEWTAPRRGDAALAEKNLRQFWWAMPCESETLTLTELDSAAITARAVAIPRGRVPAGAVRLTVGIDLGKWLCHWVAVAWMPDGTPHVVEYGRLEVPSNVQAVETALVTALRTFRDQVCKPGWASVGDGSNLSPSLVLLDARDWTAAVKTFCAESGAGFIPAQGHAAPRITGKWGSDPGYDSASYHKDGVLPVNADLWKSYVHARLQTPAGQPGGLTLFHATPMEHLSFSKHLTAEKKVEEFVAGKGLVTRWEAMSRNNHYLDALSLACVAGHGTGVRLVQMPVAPAPPTRQTDNLASFGGAKRW